jgi:malate dehydrogenase (oxaloacetate-decarboxylating)(NADP+)
MTIKRGLELLRDRKHSKSTAFTKEERAGLGLRGLLPHAISTQDIQMKRILANIARKPSNIERYIFLSALEDRNERIFYKLLIEEIDKLMPIIYTPTVGQVCKEFSHIFRKEKGFFITPDDKGEIEHILYSWPEPDVRVIVVTDGERILGLGDLGVNGMGIPIGKLALYTTAAGIHPHQCLPVMLDVGTNNQELLNDEIYLGYPHERLRGEEYFELVDEFIQAIQKKYPRALIQFEDFLTPNAYDLLHRYKDKILCFNDDIQGTASVALAGIYASQKITKLDFKDLDIMFLGAGSAATGIADLIKEAFIEEGFTEEEASQKLSFIDIDGLLVKGRKNLMTHNRAYAIDAEEMDLITAIKRLKPNVLIGASGAKGAFTKEVIETMGSINERPVLFALSNPTSKAECTAEEAYTYSDGKAIFASGSPFQPVRYKGQEFVPGQGNNAYIFPGIGLAATLCAASTIPDALFLTAAKSLATLVSQDDIDRGNLYPGLKTIRAISTKIAVDVIRHAQELEVAQKELPKDLETYIKKYMYDPTY